MVSSARGWPVPSVFRSHIPSNAGAGIVAAWPMITTWTGAVPGPVCNGSLNFNIGAIGTYSIEFDFKGWV